MDNLDPIALPTPDGLTAGDLIVLALILGLFYALALDAVNISQYSLSKDPTRVYAGLDVVKSGSGVRRAVLLFLGGSGALALARSRLRGLRIHTLLSWLTAAYLLLAVASPLWSEDAAFTLRKAVVLIMLTTAALALAQRWSFDRLMDAAILLSGASILIGFVAQTRMTALGPWDASYRFQGMVDPNTMGRTCAILAAATLARGIRGGDRRGAYLTLSGIATVLLILTKSRGALAGLIVVSGVMVLLEIRRRTVLLVVCLAMAAALSVLILVPGILGDMALAGTLGRPDGSQLLTLTGRTYLWADLLGYVHQHPWLGFGYDSFWTPRHVLEVALSQGWIPSSAHSSYMDSLLSLGWVGLCCFVIMLLAALERAFYLNARLGGPGTLFSVLLLCYLMTHMLVEAFMFETTIPGFIALVLLLRIAFGGEGRRADPSVPRTSDEESTEDHAILQVAP